MTLRPRTSLGKPVVKLDAAWFERAARWSDSLGRDLCDGPINYRDPPAPRVVTPWPKAPWRRVLWAWLSGRLWNLEFRRRWPVAYDVYVRELGRRPGRAAWEPKWWNPWRSRGRVVQALDELENDLTQKRIGDAMAEREYEIREGCE